MKIQDLAGFKVWIEASAASDAILGVVSGGSRVNDAERDHLLARRTSDFSSEIRNNLKNLGVIKSVVGRARRINAIRSIDSGVTISDLIRMVEKGTVTEGTDEAMHKKKLIVMRGVSGSGKSTMARKIAAERGGVIFSTDDFFEKEGGYSFDPKALPGNHAKNQSRAEEAMKAGVSPIIIDNTNTEAWEMRPYVQAAVDNGYEVEIVEPGSEGFPEVDFEEIMKRQSTRGPKSIPSEVVKRMMTRFKKNLTVQDILDSRSPVRP